ncbi:hypothetical protein BDW02DRAFT_511016, partial [Decorospora gaudefroyi]
IYKLKEQLVVITKRKTRKRKRVAAKAAVAAKRLKKARSSSNQKRAQPALQRCRNCGGTGHNARTCKKDTEASSKLDVSTTYVGSLFDSDKIEDA